MSPYLRKAFSKFRCSSYKLNIELGRHLNIEGENRICNCCLTHEDNLTVENEYHEYFQCDQWLEERQSLLYA